MCISKVIEKRMPSEQIVLEQPDVHMQKKKKNEPQHVFYTLYKN